MYNDRTLPLHELRQKKRSCCFYTSNINQSMISVPYAPSNNHKNKKGSQKNSNKNGASANGVSIVNSFAQGGVTLQYDQEQPLINGHSNGQHMVSASYSKNPNQSTFLARAHSHRDEAECDFTSGSSCSLNCLLSNLQFK